MTKPRAKVSFIADDFAINEFDSDAWGLADAILIDKEWSGEPATGSRHVDVRLLWSDTALYVLFEARQGEPLFLNENPQTVTKTMELWEHDVCELFLAPDAKEPRRYAEFEIAPTGEWLDLMVDWTKDEPRDWDYESGMEAFSRIEADKVTMIMKIPWPAFSGKPTAGDVWAGNLYRAVGSGETRGYLAWSPTMTDIPQFHVPENFGEFVFVR